MAWTRTIEGKKEPDTPDSGEQRLHLHNVAGSVWYGGGVGGRVQINQMRVACGGQYLRGSMIKENNNSSITIRGGDRDSTGIIT